MLLLSTALLAACTRRELRKNLQTFDRNAQDAVDTIKDDGKKIYKKLSK